MDTNQLPKNFFKKNPVDQLSAAYIGYFSMSTGFTAQLETEIFNLTKSEMDPQRLENIHQEREAIQNLHSGEDFVRFMRGNYDITNRSALCQRALTMQVEVIPLMLRRFRTSMQDMFIEAAVYILAHAEQDYVDHLKDMYPEIGNHYTQSMACLVFSMQQHEDTLHLLLSEYAWLKQQHIEQSF